MFNRKINLTFENIPFKGEAPDVGASEYRIPIWKIESHKEFKN